MGEPSHEFDRIWRVRRRHDHIDALLRPYGTAWELRYTRNHDEDETGRPQERADHQPRAQRKRTSHVVLSLMR